MKRDRVLRAIRFSPLLLALVLAAVWFSLPSGLRSRMLAPDREPSDAGYWASAAERQAAAETYLVAAARSAASRNWTDVRFADVARRSAAILPDRLDAACRSGSVPTAALDPSEASVRLLERFARENPGSSVHAYLIPQPAMPSVVASMSSLPGERQPAEYDALWRRFIGARATSSFRPEMWREPTRLAEDPASSLWSFVSRFGPDTPALAFVYRDRQPVPAEKPSRVHDEFAEDRSRWVDTDLCAACHPPESRVVGLDTRRELPSDTGRTALVGGPVQLTAVPLYSTARRGAEQIGARYLETALQTTDTAYLRLPDTAGSRESRWGTMVWSVPVDPSFGQTMLYVCTFPGNPHAEFARSLERTPAKQVREFRAWLAGRFAAILAVLGVMLGVSLVAAPAAYAFEVRRESRLRSAAELARIQRDAHDRVYNRLTALSQRVDEAARRPDETPGRLESVGDDIRATVADLQSILGAGESIVRSGETPSPVGQLEAVAVAQASLHDIRVTFSATGDVVAVPARLGWDLQCVLEEAITNAVKHGHASVLSVEFDSGTRRLRLRVTDDGIGLATGEASRSSTGLAGMRARLEPWGGTVTLAGAESCAVLTVELPVAW